MTIHPVTDYISEATYFDAYFSFNPIGEIREDPFVMRLAELKRNRQPDIMVILSDNLDKLTETYLDGAADICVEVVSDASVETDRGTKFTEYQKAGVKEYWLIDPISEEVLFYRLVDGVYKAQSAENDRYRTQLLPKLEIKLNQLLSDKFPNLRAVLDDVKAMLDKE